MKNNDAKTTQSQMETFATKHYYSNASENNRLHYVIYNGLKPLPGLDRKWLESAYPMRTRPQGSIAMPAELKYELYAEEVKHACTIARKRPYQRKMDAINQKDRNRRFFDKGDDE